MANSRLQSVECLKGYLTAYCGFGKRVVEPTSALPVRVRPQRVSPKKDGI